MKEKYSIIAILLLIFVLIFSGCKGITPPSDESVGKVEKYLGEWKAIEPTQDLSKIKIYSFGNYIYINMYSKSSQSDPEDYSWGVQKYKISDSIANNINLSWSPFSKTDYEQQIEVLGNGVLKVTSIKYYIDNSFSYTDYFYNSQDSDSFIPEISNMGIYQDDSNFINLIYRLNTPKKISQYMEKYFSYKILNGPHSPYQTYLSKEGDCGDFAVFASNIAHFHGYENYFVRIKWTNSLAHAIVVYNMGENYTYSCNQQYFDEKFNSILACVQHCSLRAGFILSEYNVFDWDYYKYKSVPDRYGIISDNLTI